MLIVSPTSTVGNVQLTLLSHSARSTLTTVRPAGSVSVTCTLAAWLGPLFVTASVHVSVEPATAVVSTASLTMETSALVSTGVVSPSVSFAPFGSVSLPETDAEFVMVEPGARSSSTTKAITMEPSAPGSIGPATGQVTTPAATVQPGVDASASNVVFAGTASVTSMPLACDGPALATVIE